MAAQHSAQAIRSLLVGDSIDEFAGTGLQVVGGDLQTTLGVSVDLTSEITGTLPLGNGGTNATTAQGAIDNISGLSITGEPTLFRWCKLLCSSERNKR